MPDRFKYLRDHADREYARKARTTWFRVLEERLEVIPEKQDLVVRVNEEEASLTLILQEDYQKDRETKDNRDKGGSAVAVA